MHDSADLPHGGEFGNEICPDVPVPVRAAVAALAGAQARSEALHRVVFGQRLIPTLVLDTTSVGGSAKVAEM
ncbi:hypothetical protein BJY24_001767 [Nocardia transvalensis]|uniref:Uncharacterized protein n=1 Tax=Nocardia transvalensis TaxID=37333 RepID=A0A7W9UHN6_9NOCA|nr:hypothetical protein [Nocardia transvalensis]MBB5912900.1 hypothetical protein [Nocardia transvalensis]